MAPDALMEYCFYAAFKLTCTDAELPVTADRFYSHHMQPARPAGQPALDAKRTSHKQIGKYVKHMHKQKAVAVREVKNTITILSVDRTTATYALLARPCNPLTTSPSCGLYCRPPHAHAAPPWPDATQCASPSALLGATRSYANFELIGSKAPRYEDDKGDAADGKGDGKVGKLEREEVSVALRSGPPIVRDSPSLSFS